MSCNLSNMSDLTADFIARDRCLLNCSTYRDSSKNFALLRTLNNIRASTRILPPEILSLIFQHVCSSIDTPPPEDLPYVKPNPRRLLTLGHVSSHWRQVVWSTPQLWVSLRLVVREDNVRRIPDILLLYLRNSGDLGFSLGIAVGNILPIIAFESIRNIIFDEQYSGKFRSLHIPMPKEGIALSSHFSRLEYLGMEGSNEEQSQVWNSIITLEGVSSLRSLYLDNVCGDIRLPWSSITTLALDFAPIDIAFDLLIQCPNLLKYRLSYTIPPRKRTLEIRFPNRPPVHRHLQEFFWACNQLESVVPLFDLIKFPALRRFSWTELSIYPGYADAVRTIFHNMPDTLVTLELVRALEWTLPLIKDVLSQGSSIQELILHRYDAEALYGVVCVLCPGWEGDPTVYLPSLKCLTIDITYLHETSTRPMKILEAKFAWRLLDLVKARFTRPGASFRVVLRRVSVKWPVEVYKVLREMVRDGFQLEIVNDGRVMEWCDDNTD